MSPNITKRMAVKKEGDLRGDVSPMQVEVWTVKVAIVTPYAGEAPAIVDRCRRSVRSQIYQDLVHYLVSDGTPNVLCSEDEGPSLRNIVLPTRHRDAGNTPRSVGALCALNDGADIICFLDVDNEYSPSHVAGIVEHARRGAFDLVFSKRRIRIPEYPNAVVNDSADAKGHVDTNCIAIARSAAFLLPMWGLMPRSLAPIGDTVMMALFRLFKLQAITTEDVTVTYWSTWRCHYASAGLEAPPNAKDVDSNAIRLATSSDELWARMRLNLNFA